MQGTPSQDNSTTGFMCITKYITNYRTMEGCNINLNHAAEKMQQASATGKPEEPEATRTITLLVTCRQASSIIGEMGRREKKVFRTSQTPGFAFAGQMIALCLHCGCLHLRVLVLYLQMLVLMGSASPAQGLTSRDNIADIIRQLRALLRRAQLSHRASRLRTTKGRAAG